MSVIPPNIARLPRDSRGFHVPWFVTWFRDGKPTRDGDGTPDFRVVNPAKIVSASMRGLCWICGGQLGRYRSFVVGPMCTINRVSAEPPSHLSCAEFAVRACPFLAFPHRKRDERGLDELVGESRNVAGYMIARNPGVSAVWTTRSYKPFAPHGGGKGVLFEIGEPVHVHWYAHGRKATLGEVMTSIETGLPALERLAVSDGDKRALAKACNAAMRWLPMKEPP